MSVDSGFFVEEMARTARAGDRVCVLINYTPEGSEEAVYGWCRAEVETSVGQKIELRLQGGKLKTSRAVREEYKWLLQSENYREIAQTGPASRWLVCQKEPPTMSPRWTFAKSEEQTEEGPGAPMAISTPQPVVATEHAEHAETLSVAQAASPGVSQLLQLPTEQQKQVMALMAAKRQQEHQYAWLLAAATEAGRKAGKEAGGDAAASVLARRDLPKVWGWRLDGACIWKDEYPGEHEQYDAKTASMPLHLYGVMSTKYVKKKKAMENIREYIVCRYCRTRDARVICGFTSQHHSNGACLVCMQTSANASMPGNTCAGCKGLYEADSSGKGWRKDLITKLLKPLELKLRFSEPSSELGVGVCNAEQRTLGTSSTGNGIGEKRYDYLLEATTGAYRVLHLAIEVVSTADVMVQSLQYKVSDLQARLQGNTGARAAMLVVYVNATHPLAHLVLVRQIVNALVVNGGKLPEEKVSLLTSGTSNGETPARLEERWERLRTDAGVRDRTTMRHMPWLLSPTDAEHEWKYSVHPMEVQMWEERNKPLRVDPRQWM